MGQNLFLTVYSAEELEAIVKNSLIDVLNGFNKQPSKPSEDFIDTKAVCNILHVSVPTIRKYRREGHLKSYRIGSKKILFKRSEVESALLNIHYIKQSKRNHE